MSLGDLLTKDNDTSATSRHLIGCRLSHNGCLLSSSFTAGFGSVTKNNTHSIGSVWLHFLSLDAYGSASVLQLIEVFWLQKRPTSTLLLPLFEKQQKARMKMCFCFFFCFAVSHWASHYPTLRPGRGALGCSGSDLWWPQTSTSLSVFFVYPLILSSS